MKIPKLSIFAFFLAIACNADPLPPGKKNTPEIPGFCIADGRPSVIQNEKSSEIILQAPKSINGWERKFLNINYYFDVKYIIVAETKKAEGRVCYYLVGKTGKTWSKTLSIDKESLDFLYHNISNLALIADGSRVKCEYSLDALCDAVSYFHADNKCIELNFPCKGTWNGFGASMISFLTEKMNSNQIAVHLSHEEKTTMASDLIFKYNFKQKDAALINGLDFYVLFPELPGMQNAFIEYHINDNLLQKVTGVP